MFSEKENINILTALLIGYGVEHVVVSPGSRNAPIVHNLDVCPQITCHLVTDERTAAFVALGLRIRLGKPVAVCVTSGSALLNTLPGVAEATYQQQGIIVISADRPEAWIGQMDGQTLPQPGALGGFVALSVTLPEPKDDTERWLCRRRICEALMTCQRPDHPSVHINVPISEPLFSFTQERLPEVSPIMLKDICNVEDREALVSLILASRRLLIVSGQAHEDHEAEELLRQIRNCVVVGEWLSPYATVRHIDEILRLASSETLSSLKPDCIIYIGGNTVSKRLRRYLRSIDDAGVPFITMSEDGLLHDVSQHTSTVVRGTARQMMQLIAQTDAEHCADAAFVDGWKNLDSMAGKRITDYEPPFSQVMAVRLFEQLMVGRKDDVCYANSMSVRLGMMYASAYRHCNRGLNGIEGSMSVANGMALARRTTDGGRVYCVIGDLSFFYDSNALWTQSLQDNLRIMLLNNSRGAIFGMLPGLDGSPAHPSLIAASHSATAQGICLQYGISYLQATDAASLRVGLDALTDDAGTGPVLLEVITDPDIDVAAYRDLNKL